MSAAIGPPHTQNPTNPALTHADSIIKNSSEVNTAPNLKPDDKLVSLINRRSTPLKCLLDTTQVCPIFSTGIYSANTAFKGLTPFFGLNFLAIDVESPFGPVDA